MATITKADLANRVLENIGVKGAGQSASTEDGTIVEEAIDSAYARLNKQGLAPYATSAIPEWAQIPLRDFVSADVANLFGIAGERLQAIVLARQAAMKEMRIQISNPKQEVPIETHYY